MAGVGLYLADLQKIVKDKQNRERIKTI